MLDKQFKLEGKMEVQCLTVLKTVLKIKVKVTSFQNYIRHLDDQKTVQA